MFLLVTIILSKGLSEINLLYFIDIFRSSKAIFFDRFYPKNNLIFALKNFNEPSILMSKNSYHRYSSFTFEEYLKSTSVIFYHCKLSDGSPFSTYKID